MISANGDRDDIFGAKIEALEYENELMREKIDEYDWRFLWMTEVSFGDPKTSISTQTEGYDDTINKISQILCSTYPASEILKKIQFEI